MTKSGKRQRVADIARKARTAATPEEVAKFFKIAAAVNPRLSVARRSS